jgi:hypothetical protein
MALAIRNNPSILSVRDRDEKGPRDCEERCFECLGTPRFSAQLNRQLTDRIGGREGNEKWLVNSDVGHRETLHGGGQGFESPRLHSRNMPICR